MTKICHYFTNHGLKKDRELVSFQQAQILEKFIDKLEFLKTGNISDELRSKTTSELLDLEKSIEQEVIDILKSRIC